MAHGFIDYINDLRASKNGIPRVKDIAEWNNYSVLKLYAGYLQWLESFHKNKEFTASELLTQLAVINAYQIQLFSQYAVIEQAVKEGECVPAQTVNHYFDGEIPAVQFNNNNVDHISLRINQKINTYVQTLDQQAYHRVSKNTDLYMRIKDGALAAFFLTSTALSLYTALHSTSITIAVLMGLTTVLSLFGAVGFCLEFFGARHSNPDDKVATDSDQLLYNDKALFKVKRATINKTLVTAIQSPAFATLNSEITTTLKASDQPTQDNGLAKAVATTSAYFINKRYDGLYSNYKQYRYEDRPEQYITTDYSVDVRVDVAALKNSVKAAV